MKRLHLLHLVFQHTLDFIAHGLGAGGMMASLGKILGGEIEDLSECSF